MSDQSLPLRVHNARELVAHYTRLRPTQLRLNHKLVERLTKDVLREGARKLGMLRGDVFYFDNEDQTSVLMDYCIYDVLRRGRNAVEQYLCDCPHDPESDEMVCLRAMQHATYGILAVLRVEPGVGCTVRNLFTDETRLLVDIGISHTAERGTILATRVLDRGEYIATGGTALPLGILDEGQLDQWQQQLQQGIRDDDFDPAPFIRQGLQSSSQILYEEPGGSVRMHQGTTGSLPESLRVRRKQLARKSRTDMGAQRCRCGSGKMYRNCCGRR